MTKCINLIKVDDSGNWFLTGVPWASLYIGMPITEPVQQSLYGALCKLKAFESLGYSPDQLEKIITAFLEVWG